MDDGFAAEALAALDRVSDQPHPLKSGERVVPRVLLGRGGHVRDVGLTVSRGEVSLEGEIEPPQD